ncbi:hypothetical protein GCM10009613_58260 [Pseudonocardia kongjuensis]|uniref:Modulator of FtsH protease n=1 Tax=Pseudonocardia kongjuensis TaxID=102227 RepID=A0ABN1YDJ1_9PSEU
MEGWTDFGVAVTGAGAALIGLLFVSMSINIRLIVDTAELPARSGFAVLLLVLPTLSAMLLTVPQGPAAYGVQLLVLSAVLGPGVLYLARPGARPPQQAVAVRLVSTVLPAAVTVGGIAAAGALLVAGRPAGAYGIVVATVGAIGGALVSTWVLLVEILR